MIKVMRPTFRIPKHYRKQFNFYGGNGALILDVRTADGRIVVNLFPTLDEREQEVCREWTFNVMDTIAKEFRKLRKKKPKTPPKS